MTVSRPEPPSAAPFRFRLNCIDHYQAVPTPLDPKFSWYKGPTQARSDPPVPVIRVFGATETGQKVCAHIHGVLPYLYLVYDGGLGETEVNEYIQSLTLSINHALALSYRRNPFDPLASTFVAHVSLVKGIPFYGYNVGYKCFLKVYILNPMCMTRLADLLLQGAVLARIFQPYESHLQYLAQWMCDYNLFGCAYIDCETVKFRGPVPENAKISNPSHRWHDGSVDRSLIQDPDQFPRQSHCAIEVDICVQHILNRKEVRPRQIHQDFMERFQELGPDEKFVNSMAGLWRDETIRRKKKMGITDPTSSPFPPEVLVSMSADPRAIVGGWIHEDEFRELMDTLAEQEKKIGPERKIGFDSFVKEVKGYEQLQTALDSIDDLYPDNLARRQRILSASTQPASTPALVNEESIHALGADQDSAYNSDEDTAREIAFTQRKKEAGIQEETAVAIPEPASEPMSDEAILLAQYDDFQNELIHDDQRRPVGLPPWLSPGWKKRKELDRREMFDEIAIIKKRKLFQSTAPPHKPSSQSSSPKKSSFRDGTSERNSRVAFEDVPKGDQTSTTTSDDVSNETPQRLSQISQGSIKAHGVGKPNTLSFPAVKNPHDPDTELRLSQRSEYSNSQKTSDPKTPFAQKLGDGSIKDSTSPFVETPFTNGKHHASLDAISPELKRITTQVNVGFNLRPRTRVFLLRTLPPSAARVQNTMLEHGLPQVIYQDAYYSDEKDVPERSREYASKEFKLESNDVPFLPDFDATGQSLATYGQKPGVVRDKMKEEKHHNQRRKMCALRIWEIALRPPTFSEVEQWLVSGEVARDEIDPGEVDVDATVGSKLHNELSQIEGPTQRGKHGFKYSQKQASTSVQHETQYMTTMSLEVHVNTRGQFVPDPTEDPIACIFWCIQSDDDHPEGGYQRGILSLSPDDGIARRIRQQVAVEVEYEEDELDLLNRMIDIVRHYDPDILTGYEVHNGSWGYLIERARLKYDFNLCDEFSRMKSQSHGRFGKEADRWGFNNTSTIRVTGRHMINIWRAMRGELNLLQYTLENVAFHVLHKRVPHYGFADLTRWYQGKKNRDLTKVLTYFLSRAQMNLEILEANELIPRTSEQARLLGVDFFSVFSRGSQFKVESLMFRIAKPENYILVSPSRKQVGQQNALECLPLVMEPQSAFYPSPLLVLDFQSLYPSVMIAYNYCYSTCLGRIVNWRGTNKMGFMDFKREPRLLELVKEYVNVAPNGIMYVRPEMRKSLLAKMLGEILETRVMVKSGMKQDKQDKTLQRLLNNRQLALKLIANVTYGYTSASFSGRMPCSEIADSIVQTGRETLEKAIAMIHATEKWGAEVVYGDTDSLFVYLKGRTRDEAFRIGKDIAEAVTNANPRPVKLKFEKVYHPCVLLAKKRYVGFKYESPNQTEPEFDAKGIETVRRDGTPAEQKIEEKALKILFRTADLSQVKSYFQRQCQKILQGRISLQDFLFAKEVKLGTYSDRGPPPPGALIATRRMLEDPRREPQYGERVPYVVITGAPGARLIDRCVDPEVLLNDDQVELDAEYYINKNLIPPLERIFNLVGANVRQWYDEMPKVQRIRNIRAPTSLGMQLGGAGGAIAKKTLENYLQSTTCLVCRAKLPPPAPGTDLSATNAAIIPLCAKCSAQSARSLLVLRSRLHDMEKRLGDVQDICRSCSMLSFSEEVKCDSRDCPVYYTRVRESGALAHMRGRTEIVIPVLEAEDRRDIGIEW